MQGKESFAHETAEDVVEYLPLYSARLDGAHSRGCTKVDDMPVESGEMHAITLQAHHPYVEWVQQCFHTMYWARFPVTFPAMRKVEVRFGVRANWSHEPIKGACISIDMMDVPRPPPPVPIAWEWCESAASYAHRIVVRRSVVNGVHAQTQCHSFQKCPYWQLPLSD